MRIKSKLSWEEQKVVICKCGHEMYWHLTSGKQCDGPIPYPLPFKRHTLKQNPGVFIFCECNKFRQDNLRYLENLYEKKSTKI
jgi:hypothetical protein